MKRQNSSANLDEVNSSILLMNPYLSQVKFNVDYKTEEGEVLYVTGGIEELGQWDPQNALEMKTNNKEFPLWKSNSDLICPLGMEIEYKYLVKDKEDKFHTEVIDGDQKKSRKITISSPGKFLIFDKKESLLSQIKCINNATKTISIFNKNENNDLIILSNSQANNLFKSDLYDLFSFENNKICQDNEEDIYDDFNSNYLSMISSANNISVNSNKKNNSINSNNNIITSNQPSINKNNYSKMTISYSDQIIIVTSQLPFEIEKNEKFKNHKENTDNISNDEFLKMLSEKYIIKTTNEKLINLALYKLKEKKLCNVKWVGLLKYFYRFTIEELEEINVLLTSKNIYMVDNLSKSEYINYWMYMNKILSPVFIYSNINIKNKYFISNEEYFAAFKRVNGIFGKLISSIAKTSDLICIGDIGLSLVPNYLYQKNINFKVGIYFHIPFPPCEVLRIFPYHSEILKSILLCDVIGFSCFKHSKNFLTTIFQEFNIDYKVKSLGNIYISYYGRDILLYIQNIEMDVDFVENNMLNNNEYIKVFNNYLEKYNNIIKEKRIVLTDIEFQYEIPRILILLEAYYDYLKENNTNTILILLITFDNSIEDKKDINDYLMGKVTEIKNKFGDDKLYIEHSGELELMEKLAIFAQTNIYFSLHKNNGLNTSLGEFIYSHSMKEDNITNVNKNRVKSFGIIIDENCELSPEINNCSRINSYNKKEIAKNIKLLLNRNNDELNEIYNHDLQYIKANNTFGWISRFLNSIKYLGISSSQNSKKIPVGIKKNFRILKVNKNFKPLDFHFFEKNYINSNHRYFFIDYENILVFEDEDEEDIEENLSPKKKKFLFYSKKKDNDDVKPINLNKIPSFNPNILPEKANEDGDEYEIDPDEINYYMEENMFYIKPKPKIMSILKSLTKDPKNQVYIITKYKKDLYYEGIFDEIPNLGFACENGLVYKLPNDNDFDNYLPGIKYSELLNYYDSILKILESFTERTEGSYIVIRSFSISWVYKDCDSYLGNMQANELTTHLKEIYEDKKIDISITNESVEIKPKDLNKGYFVSHILQNEISNKNIPDFIFAIGNNGEDEDIFKYLNSLSNNLTQNSYKTNIFSCIIGNTLTYAKYYFRSIHELIENLDSMTHAERDEI